VHGGGSSGAVSQVQVDDGIEFLRVCSPLLPVKHTAEPANGIAVAAVQLLRRRRLLRLLLVLVLLVLLVVLLLLVVVVLLLLLCLPEPSLLRWRRRRLEPREHAIQPRANGSFVRPGLDDPRQGVLTLPPLLRPLQSLAKVTSAVSRSKALARHASPPLKSEEGN